MYFHTHKKMEGAELIPTTEFFAANCQNWCSKSFGIMARLRRDRKYYQIHLFSIDKLP